MFGFNSLTRASHTSSASAHSNLAVQVQYGLRSVHRRVASVHDAVRPEHATRGATVGVYTGTTATPPEVGSVVPHAAAIAVVAAGIRDDAPPERDHRQPGERAVHGTA